MNRQGCHSWAGVTARAGLDEDIDYAYRYWPELRRRAQLMIDCFEHKLDTVFTHVLDRDNRAHDLDDMYVLDASFFPSSARSWPQSSNLD
jgi:hypothetical protein